MLAENRKNPRYQSLAKAQIDGINGGEVVLKDLSITGCCVESTMHIKLESGGKYRIEIFPEMAAHIGSFELLLESVWSRNGNYSSEFGFLVVESPKGKLFQRYVDYLSWRSEIGLAGHT